MKPLYRCRDCQHEWEGKKTGPTKGCPKCGHVYTDWINFNEMSKDIKDLFVRTILELPDDAEVSLEDEIEAIKNKTSTRSSAQRKKLTELWEELQNG